MRIKTEVDGLEIAVNEDGELTFYDYGAQLTWGIKIPDSYDIKRVLSRMRKALNK